MGFVFLFSGCSLVVPLELKNVNSFKVAENKSGGGIKITANLTLYNPNKFKLAIKNADIDVITLGVNLGKLQIPNQIIVNKMDSFSGDFHVEISLSKLLFAGQNVLRKLKSGNIEITLKGTIDSQVLWIHKSFNINHNEKIKW